MFTGIIEAFGQVKRVTRGAASAKIVVEVGALADDIKVGDSVAVDGACLTVAQIAGQVVTFDVMTETLDRTTLGDLKPSDKVNLERSLKLSDRLGGHFVSGHVDGVGILQRKTQMPGQCLVEVEATPEVTDMMIQKGSVAIDGISLTLVALSRESFSVALIPHTLANTTLNFKGPGARVNIETDMLGKWIKKLLASDKATGGLTEAKLREQGFL